ncbi:hypothetical protein MES5069_650007 [Mesorhizobium escarrei]|uniref:Uncharacterized protein n=1 Tax=Mesorhizobium escarrei TaxID=666018 RepID=A0ABM9EF77_9HYPH|nr:hypothetical protein MES5069_650007 [Mesorhizobium escarrei]
MGLLGMTPEESSQVGVGPGLPYGGTKLRCTKVRAGEVNRTWSQGGRKNAQQEGASQEGTSQAVEGLRPCLRQAD